MIKVEPGTDGDLLWITLPPKAIKEWIDAMRSVPGRVWNPKIMKWMIPATSSAVSRFADLFQEAAVSVHPRLIEAYPSLRRLSPHGNQWREKMADRLSRKGFSRNTKKAYEGHIDRFLQGVKKPVSDVSSEDIQAYFSRLLKEQRSHAYVNQAISAIRFFCSEVERRRDVPETWLRPKKEKKLPVVLSQQEVMRLLHSVANLKHRTILTLVYSAGLRVGEVVRLKRTDLDPDRGLLHIRQGKGKKDRYTVLSTVAYSLLIRYMEQERPTPWLFPGGSSTVGALITNVPSSTYSRKQYGRPAL